VSTRRVDIEQDGFFWIGFFEKKHLGRDRIGHIGIDRIAQKNNTILQEARVDIIRALLSTHLVDHRRDEKG